jgi:tetratricopeptide (TPR) repeat protein
LFIHRERGRTRLLRTCRRRAYGGFFALTLIGLPLLAGLLSAQPASISDTALPDSVQTEMRSVQELLAHATAEFEGPSQSRSIVLFDRIIEKLENLRRQEQLPLQGEEILAQVYDLQGRAYFNIGLREKTAQVFRQLIQMKPQYALSKDQVSPKIVAFFNSVKKELVGYLAVSSKPPGARVTLNGEFLSITDFFPIEVLAGEYSLEISREGYQAESRSVSIAPRETETVEATLVRTAASGFFVTQPPGVEIWIDGVLRATTGGSLHPSAHEELVARGFDPAHTSARTEVVNIALGSHTIEFRKRCYEAVRTSIDVLEAKDYDIEPVRLQESLASLRVISDPPGARIILDGEPRGVTPAYLEGLCSGSHNLEVRHAAGKFVQEIILARNEELILDCPIRPSLAFLGVLAEDFAAERFLTEAETRIWKILAEVRSLNIVRPSRERVNQILGSEGLTLADLLPRAGGDPERVRKASERIAAELDVQGFLIAALSEQQILRDVSLSLLAAGSSLADTRDTPLVDTDSNKAIVGDLDHPVNLSRTWSGLITIDTKRQRGLPVLRVGQGGPAERAGLRAGEVVISADGRSLSSTRELLDLVAAKRPGSTLRLVVEQSGASRVVELKLETTPLEVTLNDPRILYNRLMLDLRQDLDGRPGTESAAFAHLNLGLCALHFGDLVAAHEHFLKAARELPSRPGLGRGAAFYRLGVVLERIGYPKEALESYRAASAVEGATLIDNDGPLVKDVAPESIGR